MKKNQAIQAAIIKATQSFLIESGHKQAYRAVTLEKSLTYDLGIGSIERIELMQRLEKIFSIRLEENSIARADNLDVIYEEILNKLEQKQPEYHFVDHIADLPEIDMRSAESLVDILLLGKQQDPLRTWLYLQNADGKEATLSYQELYNETINMACYLKEKGLRPGNKIVIALPTSCEFFYAFFASLLLGGRPIISSPLLLKEKKQSLPPFLIDGDVDFVIAEDNLKSQLNLKKIIFLSPSDALDVKHKDQNICINEKNNGVVGLLTAGTTGDKKEILLRQESVLENIKSSIDAMSMSPSDIVVNWLPLNNSVSLISMCLTSLYAGIPLVLIDYNDFLQQPERWLWAIHFHQGTISVASDFDLAQCTQKIKFHTLDGLDISSCRVALVATDQPQVDTLNAFNQKFSPYGFKETCLTPAYALTENGALLTISNPGNKYQTDQASLDRLLKENTAEKTDTSLSIDYVNCGEVVGNNDIRIADSDGVVLKDRQIGKIQFSRPSSFEDDSRRWISSGDYGYTVNKSLFVIGREQGLIYLKESKQCYAKVIENLVGMLPDINANSVAAFNDSNENYILVVETTVDSASQHSNVREIVSKKLKQSGISTPEKIIFLKNNSLPRTLSGKIKRFQCKKDYENNSLGRELSPSLIQKIKVKSKKIWNILSGKIKFSLRVIYTFYVGIILVLTGPPGWIIIMCLPRKLGAKFLKLWCKFLFASMFCPIKYSEDPSVGESKTPIVYTANHTGYLDIVALISVLPSDISYIGKQELSDVGFLKKLMQHLGYIFVNPVDFTKTPGEIAEITETVKSGRSVLIFAEGTFTYATGLRPFKMGTFKIAAETMSPVCPVSIQGVRTVLRDGSCMFRPNFIKIHVSSLIFPVENSWSESLRLRDEAYKAIADNCGEKTISLIAAGPPKKED